MAAQTPNVAEAARVRLAASGRAAPATLLQLAIDPCVTVRASLMLGPSATPDLDDLMAADRDAPIRVLLARKLATALPQHTAAGRAELAARATATLARLVEDEAEQVRTVIAAALAEWPDAPRVLVLRLARDAAAAVSDPVIRLSQALTEADLLHLLTEPPSPTTGHSIARRARLSETVADALVATSDTAAISALLANPTAATRQATLDALIARSAATVEWQAPLARRPSLPPRAALLLSHILTTDLLAQLAERSDLPRGLLERLRADLGLRQSAAAGGDPALADEPTEAAFAAALVAGERWRAMGILAAAANVPFAAVDHAGDHRNVKALVSLLWQAGFSMQLAPAAQSAITHVAPGSGLAATPDGGFPLTEREMVWQIELLAGTPALAAAGN